MFHLRHNIGYVLTTSYPLKHLLFLNHCDMAAVHTLSMGEKLTGSADGRCETAVPCL